MSRPSCLPESRSLPCGQGLRRALRTWVLVLLAWQGPLPWFHCHGTLSDCPPESAAWLSAHLRAEHAGCCWFGHRLFGWHFHAELPDSSDEGSHQPPAPRRAQIPPASVAAGLSLQLAASGRIAAVEPVLPDLADCWANHPCHAQWPTASGHFYDSFAPSLALPVRLGVIRS